MRVFVTGIGMVSGIGRNVDDTLDSVYAKKSGIGEISLLDTIHSDVPVSEVKCSDEELAEELKLGNLSGISRTTLLGLTAAREAARSAGINDLASSSNIELRTGLISATTVGGMDKSEKYYLDFLSNDLRNDYIKTHDAGAPAEIISDYLGIKDFTTTISTACSSSANSIMLGARLIRSGIIDRAICGGTDALCKFTLNGFNTLLILDRTGCKPFDENRNGLTLGEGAGYVVLEPESVVEREDKHVLCEIKGWANANDAFHQTASSPEGYGAWLAMSGALKMSGLEPDEIDYINAHGTGTTNNDLAEGKAIEKLFDGGLIPPVSSTKGMTGHTLGAAGGIEAVLAVLAIREGIIYPNLNFTAKMQELSFTPCTTLNTNQKIRNVLSNSFGFGGNNSTLIFSKVK